MEISGEPARRQTKRTIPKMTHRIKQNKSKGKEMKGKEKKKKKGYSMP